MASRVSHDFEVGSQGLLVIHHHPELRWVHAYVIYLLYVLSLFLRGWFTPGCFLFVSYGCCLVGFCRYALDVHIDRAEDVLTHKRLLEEAKIPEKMPAFHVRAVQVRKKPITSSQQEVNVSACIEKIHISDLFVLVVTKFLIIQCGLAGSSNWHARGPRACRRSGWP